MVQTSNFEEPSDWAGDRSTGRSTSGGVLMFGNSVVKTWASTQQTVAVSSGEVELYAMTKAATQCVGVIQLLGDFGIKSSGIIFSDSTAAIGIVCREGLGRTRHIRVQYLWLQGKVRDNELKVSKVSTGENVADLMTKHLKVEDRKAYENMNMVIREGRAEKISVDFVISNLEAESDKWLKANTNKVDDGEELKLAEFKKIEISREDADKLINQLMKEEAWLRCHRKPRQSMFTPMKVAGGPKNACQVGGMRISILREVSTSDWHMIVDDWKTSVEPHCRVPLSQGYTAFLTSSSDSSIDSILGNRAEWG